jgi:hypothetical protein
MAELDADALVVAAAVVNGPTVLTRFRPSAASGNPPTSCALAQELRVFVVAPPLAPWERGEVPRAKDAEEEQHGQQRRLERLHHAPS